MVSWMIHHVSLHFTPLQHTNSLFIAQICDVLRLLVVLVSGIRNCIPRTKYVRGILWFSRRYAASAFHRLRDNFKKPYRIASIFYM